MDVAASPPAAPAPGELDRRSISVLGIRRRYWEQTHGWTVPTTTSDGQDLDAPGRVA